MEAASLSERREGASYGRGFNAENTETAPVWKSQEIKGRGE
jgi:hypothetical protein